MEFIIHDPEIVTFNNLFSDEEKEVLGHLDTPARIQDFLDSTVYSSEDINRSPKEVFRDRIAHCLDGALFAAAMLRRMCRPPLIIDLLPEPGTDDDHVLAIYQENNLFGAIAKSNFTGLRFREPIFKSPRELVLSYFENFFNVDGRKTLRGYTRIINLITFDRFQWLHNSSGVDYIEKRLRGYKPRPLFSADVIKFFNKVDPISYSAGMLVVNRAGLYKPKREESE